MPRTYLTAMFRFQRKARTRETKARVHQEAKRERRQARTLAALDTLPTHLLRQCRNAGDRPSLLTAKLLRDMTRNLDLPASVRVEAAAILMRWAFPECPTMPEPKK